MASRPAHHPTQVWPTTALAINSQIGRIGRRSRRVRAKNKNYRHFGACGFVAAPPP
jgi:hypothetical protein